MCDRPGEDRPQLARLLLLGLPRMGDSLCGGYHQVLPELLCFVVQVLEALIRLIGVEIQASEVAVQDLDRGRRWLDNVPDLGVLKIDLLGEPPFRNSPASEHRHRCVFVGLAVSLAARRWQVISERGALLRLRCMKSAVVPGNCQVPVLDGSLC